MKNCRYVTMAALVLFCFVAVTAAGAKGKSTTIVQTKYGKVEGYIMEDFFDVTAWKGIPYAEPPVGELRWKAPQDPEPWDGVLDAGEYGNKCLQSAGWGSSDFQGNEDCLYLNVWRPDTKKKKLPVFVWIHGGSNTSGSGQGSWYTVAHHYNAVVVSINYRLGALGWFSHPALKTGNKENDSGNFGTLDQIGALQWVKKNIKHFGGDPKNVTLAGESAGAQNVSYVMHSRLAKNLFNKAIIESNYPGIRPMSAAYKSSKQVLYNLLVADGIAGDTAAAKAYVETQMSDADIKNYFYGKSAGDITDGYYDPGWGPINWGDFSRNDIAGWWQTTDRPEFVYCIGDGYVLPDDIDFADFTKGHVYPKPLIVGTTRNENNYWNATYPFNFRRYESLEDLTNAFVYEGDDWWGFGFSKPEEFKEGYKFATELIDEVDMYIGAQMSARNLVETKPKVNVYVYRFDWGSDKNKTYKIPYEDAWVFYMGAPHGAEMDFFHQKFFGLAYGDSVAQYQYTAENLPGRQMLSSAIGSYLKEFIHDKKGKIKKKKDQPVQWRPWTGKKEQFIVFDADYDTLDVYMNDTDIYRTPEELYDAHGGYDNYYITDFIEYYILWSWHWNWFPESSVDPFDTSPGPNAFFDPANP